MRNTDDTSDLQVYYSETARNYYDKAVLLKTQSRRAAAQEAIQEAQYWVFKCQAENVQGLTALIADLQNEIY
tara:strand:+ start:570 stop:785 length:216 start_codon:yes stop_codon:yes gene_type:complete